MAIDITGANVYFGATIHTRSAVWTQLPQADRIAAIAQAKDLIKSRLKATLETDTTVAGDFPRHDAAIYEQALWMLENEATNTLLRNQIMNNPDKLGGSLMSNVRAMQALSNIYAPAAVRFIRLNPKSVRLERG